MLALLKPKICPDRAMTHCDTGGLSTEMKLRGSSEPNSNGTQFWDRPRSARIELIAHPVDGDVPQVDHSREEQHHRKRNAFAPPRGG
jgi:hypothetical protein